jgi:Uma2 family endonuclease
MTEIAYRPATMDDLLATDGKAELINGRIVEFPMPGDRPGRVAGKIFKLLDDFAIKAGFGEARGDGVDYDVGLLASGRQSFRPDASFYTQDGPVDPDDAVPGPPTLAIEVRSKEDHTPSAEREMAAKRADYFEAGTLAVWDVNPRTKTVALYVAGNPETAVVFHSGETAHAGPAVPGWTMPVDAVFA